MSHQEVTDTASILIVGGSETTATLIIGATYYLLKNPEVLKKAQDEVRSTFIKDEEININSVYKLTYLRAVVEESLRIYPPGSSIFPRRTGAVPETIDGHVVPPDVSINLYSCFNKYTCIHL